MFLVEGFMKTKTKIVSGFTFFFVGFLDVFLIFVAVLLCYPGDEVFGVIGPHRQGSFAEYVATNLYCIAKKPRGMSHSAAASLPYIACTAWQVLKLVENLPAFSTKRVLLIGASGGVGSFSLQYLKTLSNVHITAVCGTAAVDLVASLGADDVIDYQTANVEEELKAKEKYDVVFQVKLADLLVERSGIFRFDFDKNKNVVDRDIWG